MSIGIGGRWTFQLLFVTIHEARMYNLILNRFVFSLLTRFSNEWSLSFCLRAWQIVYVYVHMRVWWYVCMCTRSSSFFFFTFFGSWLHMNTYIFKKNFTFYIHNQNYRVYISWYNKIWLVEFNSKFINFKWFINFFYYFKHFFSEKKVYACKVV
jgi:hypothetical protein